VNRLLRAHGIPYPIVAGDAQRPFALASPLAAGLPAVLSYGKGRAAAHVASLEAFGLRAGASDLQAALGQGLLQLTYAPPLQAGSLRARASLAMTGKPWIARLPEDGLLLREAPLTDELLHLLARINPLLGACTAISGLVSIEIRNGSLPLAASYARETSFDAVVELRDAVIAPGGALADMLAHTGAAGRRLELEQQRLAVTCRDGRMRLSPHRATVNGQPVLFTGSVGLDQTVAYRVDLPLTADLVGDAAARFLADRTVSVAVTGTVRRPVIDSRALAAELRRLTTDAARQALSEQAADLLERLRRQVE
jgi:hypothetical protein